ncbi:hypothetical protein HPB50_028035 [Hyalomma asiaticum]|nr:hypothetical protein HPB50_028035 [Hyalomma asiaticum]
MGTVEAILDRAKAAITEFLQLPNQGSQQAPRCKVNPDNPQHIHSLYRRNRRWAIRLIAEGPLQLCPINPGTLHSYFSTFWSPTGVDMSLLSAARGVAGPPTTRRFGPLGASFCSGTSRWSTGPTFGKPSTSAPFAERCWGHGPQRIDAWCVVQLPPLPHIAICPSSFLTLRGLMNHEQRHRREAALQARQATTSATPRSPNGFEPPPSSTQGASSAVPSRPAPSPPQSQTPEAQSQGGHRESSSE